MNALMHVSANASSSRSIVRWQVHRDGNDRYSVSNGSSINTDFSETGRDVVVIRVWDANRVDDDVTQNIASHDGLPTPSCPQSFVGISASA